MKTDIFNKHIWLLSILSNSQLSFKEISDKWDISYLNDTHQKLTDRTFLRHKKSISTHLGYDIKYSRATNTYYIANSNEVNPEERKKWLMESFSIFNMLQEGYGLKDRILFERISYGSENLTTLLDAIKSNKRIAFDYKSSSSNDFVQVEGEPYCLKIDKQRWYVLLRKDDKMRNYALDSRARNIRILEETFEYPKDFSASGYYQYSYGIWVSEDLKPQKVKIKAFGKQINYLRSLPLHTSQRETIIDDQTSIFEYYICTDIEFMQELFRMGSAIKVLEPQELVDFVREEAKKVMDRYKEE